MLTGAQAVVGMLQAHGVEVVFGLCGDTSLPLYDALRESTLTHILTRDERHAAYMADGYARVTGRVGVCEGPSGGGATYLLPGLVEARGRVVEGQAGVAAEAEDVPDAVALQHANERVGAVHRKFAFVMPGEYTARCARPL